MSVSSLIRTVTTYDSRGNPIQKDLYDSKGALVSSTYKAFDSNNRMIEEIDPLGRSTRFEYDVHSNKIREESPSGKTTYFFYNATNKLIRKEEHHPNGTNFTTQYDYNALGELTKEIDTYGHETRFIYDTFGREIERIYPIGKISKAYNTLGQLTSETDENGYTTRYTRNIYGSPVKIHYPDGSTVQHFYTLSGLLERTHRPDGSLITYNYDQRGHLTLKELRGADGNLYEREAYHYKGSQLLSKSDFSDLTTHYFYDAAGRLTGTRTLDKFTHFELDDFGRKKKVIENDRVTLYNYDAVGNILSCSHEDLKGKSYYRETFKYDVENRQIEKSSETLDGLFVIATRAYNTDGTLHSEQDEEGNLTTWSYNYANVLEVTEKDPRGCLKISTYDPVGNRVRKEILYNGEILYSESTLYDPARHPIQTTVNDFTVHKTYNPMGHLIELNESNHKITRFEVDPFGQVTKKILPDGTEIFMTYDPAGRRLTQKAPGISYEYLYLKGNLVETRDLIQNQRFTRAYDAYGRLIADSHLSFEYDLFDRLTKMELPDHSSVHYIYDAYHLRLIRRPDYEIACPLYDKKGRLLTTTSPAGSIHFAYDHLGRVRKIASSQYESHYHAFDPCGNLLSETEITPHASTQKTYRYDGLNHLSYEEGTVQNTFAYDGLGNCTEENGLPIPLNSLNQLASPQYLYDLNGQLIQELNRSYRYDALGRLTHLIDHNQETRFTYDGSNRCHEIITDNSTKTLLYQGDMEIGSLEHDQLTEFRLIHPANERTFALELDSKPYFVRQDARHNLVHLQTTDATSAALYTYSTFKEELSTSNPLSPWRLGNRRQIGPLSLFTHRFYHSELRRWLTPDPLGFVDGYNLYTYNKNNPSRYYDRDGRMIMFFPVLFVAFDLGVSITAASIAVPTLYTALTALTAATVVYGSRAIDQRYGTHINQALFQSTGCSILTMNQALTSLQEEETKKKPQDKPQEENEAPEEKKLSERYPIKVDESGQKTVDLYSPDRKLPQTKHGVKIPDSDAPHTQLSTANGKFGKYPKAREWGENGKHIRDIDFTDHNRPWEHPCPHQHPARPNCTGGTPNRGKELPLDGW